MKTSEDVITMIVCKNKMKTQFEFLDLGSEKEAWRIELWRRSVI